MDGSRPEAGGNLVSRVRPIAERVAQSFGLEIWDLQFRREPSGWVLRVIIDQPEREAAASTPAGSPEESPEDSIGIAECERVSRELSAILDYNKALADFEAVQETSLSGQSGGLGTSSAGVVGNLPVTAATTGPQ